jgi:Amt family ammonium transporter
MRRTTVWSRLIVVAAFAMASAITPALAQTSKIDAADTAWMISATALVLMMTIPGLALFYAGLVRKKNILATMAQSLASVAIISILWASAGYSLAFTGEGAWLGSLDRLFLLGMGMDSTNALAKNIPESLFMLYEMAFAIITVALISGSVADRMKFSAFLLFGIGWLFLVYVPSAHWVWGGGFLSAMGVLDFAGGTVVHLNAGLAGLIAALVLRPRRGYGLENLSPHDLSLAVVGTGLLWVGWFGFNGGSALGANSRAAMAIASTHLAASTGAFVWMALEWWKRGKPSVLGMISGAIAGLGTITPASGYVLPWHGIVIGGLAGLVCFWACTALKERLHYDDSLDVFGIHGIGGTLGTLLTGIFATAAVSISPEMPNGIGGVLEGNWNQLKIQAIGIAITGAWCAVVSFVLLKLIDRLVGLRVGIDAERMGLDISLHGEALQ